MKELWESLPEDGKPEWLSMEDIDDLKCKMLSSDIFYPAGDGRLQIHKKNINANEHDKRQS